jgi:PleD family two-component response regulator
VPKPGLEISSRYRETKMTFRVPKIGLDSKKSTIVASSAFEQETSDNYNTRTSSAVLIH